MPEFTVDLPYDADIQQVIASAGGDIADNRYDADLGIWVVVVPSSEALARALKAYDYRADKLARIKRVMRDRLARKRWGVETAGVVIDGRRVSTDRVSQAMITAAFVGRRDGEFVDFKDRDGAWHRLTPAQLSDLHGGVRGHVQACFTNEKELASKIDMAKDTASLAAIDVSVGWPATDPNHVEPGGS